MPSRTDTPSDVVVKSNIKPLSNFTRLSKIVSLYEPPQSSSTVSPTAPTTILFCAWMNASPKHIEYYIKTYMHLYPQARIILVTINTVQFLLQSETTRRADAKEAVTALLAAPQETDRLFVHSLSNGGAKRCYSIAGAYRTLTGKPLPVKAWIIDSAPGIPQFRRDIHALGVPARRFSWFLWLPYMTAVLVATSAVFVSVNWMPKWWWRELVWGPHDGMVDHRLVDKKCVKGFIYSKDDLAIDWKNVEAHASVAEKKGYRVEKKRVEGAQHVQLFKAQGGEKDYWGYIENIWGISVE